MPSKNLIRQKRFLRFYTFHLILHLICLFLLYILFLKLFLQKHFAIKPGYFGIPEPEDGEIVTWEEAFMVMPGVAFDPMNHRVGYGGGFYDRFLEKHPKVLKAALAFECQIMPEVPYEATDIFPDWVVTEKRVLIKEG